MFCPSVTGQRLATSAHCAHEETAAKVERVNKRTASKGAQYKLLSNFLRAFKTANQHIQKRCAQFVKAFNGIFKEQGAIEMSNDRIQHLLNATRLARFF